MLFLWVLFLSFSEKEESGPKQQCLFFCCGGYRVFPLASAQFLPALMGAGLGHIYINPIPDSWKGLGKDGRTREGRKGGDTHPHSHTPTHPHHAGALIPPVLLCFHNSLSLMVHTLGSVCVVSDIPFQWGWVSWGREPKKQAEGTLNDTGHWGCTDNTAQEALKCDQKLPEFVSMLVVECMLEDTCQDSILNKFVNHSDLFLKLNFE